MNLAKYSLDNTKIVYFFLAVLLIGGVFSFGRLGKKEDAPFVIKTAVIMTRYPGRFTLPRRCRKMAQICICPESTLYDAPTSKVN